MRYGSSGRPRFAGGAVAAAGSWRTRLLWLSRFYTRRSGQSASGRAANPVRQAVAEPHSMHHHRVVPPALPGKPMPRPARLVAIVVFALVTLVPAPAAPPEAPPPRPALDPALADWTPRPATGIVEDWEKAIEANWVDGRFRDM